MNIYMSNSTLSGTFKQVVITVTSANGKVKNKCYVIP